MEQLPSTGQRVTSCAGSEKSSAASSYRTICVGASGSAHLVREYVSDPSSNTHDCYQELKRYSLVTKYTPLLCLKIFKPSFCARRTSTTYRLSWRGYKWMYGLYRVSADLSRGDTREKNTAIRCLCPSISPASNFSGSSPHEISPCRIMELSFSGSSQMVKALCELFLNQ